MAIIVVQEINTRWTKRSRGGVDAERRNAVPQCLAISTRMIPTRDITVLHHQVYYGEWDNFAKPKISIAVNPTLPLRLGCVTIDRVDTGAIAIFKYDRVNGGAPERDFPRKSIRTDPGTWAQIAYNGRFSIGYDAYWEYRKKVVNVGVFEQLRTSVFTSSEPEECYKVMGHLL